MSLELESQYDKIYNFCYFKVKNREVAEDITQETFLKYFTKTDYLEKGKKLAFLYTIARNLCMDYFRKDKKQDSYTDIEEQQDKQQKEEDMTNKVDTAILVKLAVNKLDIEEQEIVLLRFTNELSVSEIAQYIGVSRFAMYRRIKSIESKLTTYLREEDFYG